MEIINLFVYDRPLDSIRDRSVSIIREAEINEVILGMRRGDYFALLAPNHTGKTTFIYQLIERIKQVLPHYRSIYINFEGLEHYDLEVFFQHLAQYIILRFRKEEWTGISGGAHIKNAGLFKHFLETIVSKIDFNLIFLLDGIEVLSKEIARELLLILRAIYNESSTNPNFRKFNILISGTVDLLELTMEEDAKTSPFNIAKPIILRDFREDEVKVFIQQLKTFGIEINSVCINKLYEFTRGHPYMVQKICYMLVEIAQRKMKDKNKEIILKEFEECIEKLSAEGDEIFAYLTLKLERDLKSDLELLNILENLLYGEKDTYIVGEWDTSFKKLELAGLIVKEGNKVRIRTPIYKKVLKRHFTKAYFARIHFAREEYGKASTDFISYYDDIKQDELKTVARISQMQVDLITKATISMLSKLSFEEILNKILEAIVQCFGYERSYLYLIDRKGGKLECYQVVDSKSQISKDKLLHIYLKGDIRPLLRWVILEQEEYSTPDIETQAKTDPYLKQHFGDKGSVLAIPLISEYKSLGILAVYNISHPIEEKDRNLIFFFAGQISLIIKNDTICKRLHILNKISEMIASEEEFSTILNKVITKILDGIDVSEIAFFELQDGVLKIKADMNWSQKKEYKLGEGFIGVVGKIGKPNKILETNEEKLAVPLKLEDKVIGVLVVRSVIPNSFDTDDMEFLSTCGEQIVMAIDKVKHFEEIERRFNKMYEEEIKREMEQLKHTRLAAIGELADRAAHEINNPLSSIRGLTDLLLKKDVDNEDLRRINLATQQAQAVIDGLREAKILSPNLRPINVNAVLNDALGQLKQELYQNGITPSINLAQNLPHIKADTLQLGQVFTNIIKNAMQAMSKGGRLEVKTYSLDDGFVRVEISDTGVGISNEDINKVFDPFFTRGGHKGKGLGLWICRGIIKEHGGKIEVKSKEGEGTTFTIILPVK